MPQGLQAVFALLLLLPGFISSRIARMMNARSEQSELDRVIEALIFSFFIYVAYVVTFGAALPIEWKAIPAPVGNAAGFGLVVHRGRILSLSVASVGAGLFWGYIRSREWDQRLLGLSNPTGRGSRESVWNYAFHHLNGYVQVGLAGGRMVLGWLKRYSYIEGERSLFLERASWLNGDDPPIQIEGAGILLTEKSDINFIMFLDNDAANQLDSPYMADE